MFLPKQGLIYTERGPLSEILCKPRIMPIKASVVVAPVHTHTPNCALHAYLDVLSEHRPCCCRAWP